jgi:hypothetical protein
MKRLFERCPNCNTDLSNALARYFHSSGDYQTYFDYTCGGCGAVLEIEVEAVPQFYCTLKSGLTPVGVDAALTPSSAGSERAATPVE